MKLARGRDREYLASGGHEVVRVTWVFYRPEASIDGCLLFDEFDAEVSAIGKADDEHWLSHAGVADRRDLAAAKRVFETPLNLIPPTALAANLPALANPVHRP